MIEKIKLNSELLFNKATAEFDKLEAAYKSGNIQEEQQLIKAAFEAFEEFFTYMGKPNFYVRHFTENGPMWSEDYNDMMDEIMLDFKQLYREAELLSKALSADFNHHTIQEDLLKNQLNQTIDKMKDLEMYNEMGSGTRVFARDHFLNADKIDFEKMQLKPLGIENGLLTLPVKEVSVLDDTMEITVIQGNKKEGELYLGSSSNGFPGNNTEVIMQSNNTLTVDGYEPVFVGSSNAHGNILSLIDNNPNTWFEYEKVELNPYDVEKVAKGYGFEYEISNGQTIRWEGAPDEQKLKLTIQIDLEEKQVINNININMFVPTHINAQAAVVKNILVSDGFDNLTSIISNDTNEKTSFYFTPRLVKTIQIIFEQDKKYATDIGHIFFQEESPSVNQENFAIEITKPTDVFANRVKGKLINIEQFGMNVQKSDQSIEVKYPKLNNKIDIDNIEKNFSMNDKLKSINLGENSKIKYGIESFEGHRWCIGIRDITISRVEFEEVGELITKPFYFEKEIEKISLEIEEEETLAEDWLSYYVSIDDGSTWYPINPMKHISVDGIPKIYTVKKVAEESQALDSDASYIETAYPVYSLRLRIVGKQPEKEENINGWIQNFAKSSDNDSLKKNHSPILKSFSLGVDLNKYSKAVTSDVIVSAPDSITRPLGSEKPGEDNGPDGEGGLGTDGGNDKDHDDSSKMKVEILDKPDYQLKLCQGSDLQLNIRVKTPYTLKQFNLYVHSSLYSSKTFVGDEKESMEFITIPAAYLPQDIGYSFVIMAEGMDSKGESSVDKLIVSIKDCINDPGSMLPGDNNGSGESGGGSSNGGGTVTNGSISITKFPTEKEFSKDGSVFPSMCEENWLALPRYAYKGRVEAAGSPIKKIDFYEDGAIVKTVNFKESEYRLTYAFEQEVTIEKYKASLNYTFPQVVAEAFDGSKATAIFQIDVHACTDDELNGSKDDKLVIKNATTKWCQNTTFSIDVGITAASNAYNKVELYQDGVLIKTNEGARLKKTTFYLTPEQIPHDKTVTFLVKAYNTKNDVLTASEIVEFYDCSGNTTERLNLNMKKRTSSICLCNIDPITGQHENIELEGEIISTAGLEKVEISVSRMSVPTELNPFIPFDYENITADTLPDLDYCQEWFNNNGNEVKPPDIENGGDGGTTEPPPVEPPQQKEDYLINEFVSFGNSITEPTGIDLSFFDNKVATFNSDYWVGAHAIPNGINTANGLFYIESEFWKGRNDLLDAFDGASPAGESNYKNSKINENDPFYNALYHFSENLDGVVLPTPFSEFNKWAIANLEPMDNLKKLSIYATWLFKKPTIIKDPFMFLATSDNLLDLIAHYMVNDKIKRFTYHWIDFSDVEIAPGVLAFVADFPGLKAFLSYVNFEDTVLDAGLSNAKATRPLDYLAKKGQSFDEPTQIAVTSDFSKYNLSTPNFGKDVDYFTLDAQLKPEIIGLYAGVESAIHEIGHAISNYGTEAYSTYTIQKYYNDAGKTLHDYKEWQEISGWDALSESQKRADGVIKFTKTKLGSLLDNGKESPVSTYGATNHGEDFAEAFSFYVMNPRFLQEKWPKKFAFMEKYVKNMPSVEIDIANKMSSKEMKIKAKKPLPPVEPINQLKNVKVIDVRSEKNYEDIEDFGEWLEQFEIDEDCGCRKRKNGMAAWRTKALDLEKSESEYVQEISSDKIIQSTDGKTTFKFVIPAWFVAKVKPKVNGVFYVHIKCTSTTGKTFTSHSQILIKQCNEDGSETTPSPTCYKMKNVLVRYYDYDLKSIKELIIPKTSLTLKHVKNNGGGALDVGWDLKRKGVILRQVVGAQFPGYQIQAVGLEYENLEGQVVREWTSKIIEKSENTTNIESVLSGVNVDGTFNNNWVTEAQNGDFTDAPTLMGAGEYAIFGFSDDWEAKGCSPGFTYQWPPIEKPANQIYECQQKQFIAMQYYDDVNKRLRYLQVDIRAKQGTLYTMRQSTGNVDVIIGWSDYFRGPLVQVRSANGNTNGFITAIGLVYRELTGESVVLWADQLKYSTNGVKNAKDVLVGFRKNVESISWINPDKTVNMERATYLGATGDMMAFYINPSKLPKACKDESSIDVDAGIDPTNPPDVPIITWEVYQDFACNGPNATLANEFKGIINSNTPFKQVDITVQADKVIFKEEHWPFAEGVTSKDFDIIFAASDYPPGTEILLTITTTNIFDIKTSEVVRFLVSQCYAGRIQINTVPETPINFYYEDVLTPIVIANKKVDVQFGLKITEDLIGIKNYYAENAAGIKFGNVNIPAVGTKMIDTLLALQLDIPEKVTGSLIPIDQLYLVKIDIIFMVQTYPENNLDSGPKMKDVKRGLDEIRNELMKKGYDLRVGLLSMNLSTPVDKTLKYVVKQNLTTPENINFSLIPTNTGWYSNFMDPVIFLDETKGLKSMIGDFRKDAFKCVICVIGYYVPIPLTFYNEPKLEYEKVASIINLFNTSKIKLYTVCNINYATSSPTDKYMIKFADALAGACGGYRIKYAEEIAGTDKNNYYFSFPTKETLNMFDQNSSYYPPTETQLKITATSHNDITASKVVKVGLKNKPKA